MNMKFSNRSKLVASVSMGVIGAMMMADMAVAQAAQQQPETVIVTGSSIKRKVLDNALPMQIITKEEIEREGISSAEQLNMLLTSNGTGPDNLASNADVVTGQQRGANGISSANLRGQGAGATLVLFNGRRIAASGLNSSVVDVNQIPFAAIERVDVLKDGASAIYGTDAIGGVINYITKKNYQGLNAQTFVDITEEGGSEIYRASIVGGYGDLNEQKFNIMVAANWSDNKALDGKDRDWLNGFQPNKGLSIDTRGTPFATVFAVNASPVGTGANPNGSLLGGTSTTLTSGINRRTPFLPGSTTVLANGINTLDLPGGAGCGSVDGMQPYDAVLWNSPGAALGCAWDTGRAVVLQQPITKKNLVARGILRLGRHELSSEVMVSNSVSAKRFSNPQFSTGALTTANANSHSNFLYPLNAITKSTYDSIYNQLQAVFPTLGAPSSAAVQPADSRYGLPIGYRWRCVPCGQREIETETDAGRAFIGLDGPMGAEWEYRTGASFSYSESSSLLGSGYYYRHTNTPNGNGASQIGKTGIVDMLNKGNINPFSLDGTQTAAALADLESASAKGARIFGGRYTVAQVDGSVSGPLWNLPGGRSYAAFGFDLREEKFSFSGDTRNPKPEIFLAPTDDPNKLDGVSRRINALYGELMLPVIKNMELTLAVRRDEYSGFGATTNPKISLKYRPFEPLMFRGSYNTGFKVPSFGQLFNGVSAPILVGNTLADPGKCPGAVPNVAIAGCEVVNPVLLQGGNTELEPEEAEQMSFGAVWELNNDYSVSVDWWSIERNKNLVALSPTQLAQNYSLFTDKFIRDSSGNLIIIDGRTANAGEMMTKGLEVGLRGRGKLWGGSWSASVDGTYLLEKKSRLLPSAPWSASEIGVFTLYGDLGLQWKHNASFTYRKGDWSGSLSQIYRPGFTNGQLPGVANGSIVPPELVRETEDYVVYNTSVTYRGFKNFTVTAGVKNLFNQDPPFTITYDSGLGSGSNWEPRVADPRGRSFTLLLDYKF